MRSRERSVRVTTTARRSVAALLRMPLSVAAARFDFLERPSFEVVAADGAKP